VSKAGAAEERKGPVNVKRTRSLLVLGLVAVLALSAGAWGGDDDDASSGSGGSGGEAAAPPPSTAFNDLTTALEGQGLVVAPLPKGSLDGRGGRGQDQRREGRDRAVLCLGDEGA
jgi:hypothetical protein